MTTKIQPRYNRRKTTEQYKEELLSKNPDIEVLDDYVTSNEKILHRCRKCGFEWFVSPDQVLHGHGCKKCTNHCTMTNEDFLDYISDKLNPNVEIIGEYLGTKSPILCRCKKCGNEWNSNFNRLKIGNGCKKCADKENALKKTISIEEYKNRLYKTFLNNVVLIDDTYINISNSATFKCTICENIWEANCYSVLKMKYGCRKCATNKNAIKSTKTHQQFEEQLKFTNPNIQLLSEYTGVKNKVKCKCLICNNIWEANTGHLLGENNTGCPECSISKGEKEISKILNKYLIQYEPQYKYDDLIGVGGGQLSYDFYLPEYNLLIEFQGEQHIHWKKAWITKEGFERQLEHDRRKREYAKEHNIELFEIWYYDIDNIEKILTEKLNLETVETTGVA